MYNESALLMIVGQTKIAYKFFLVLKLYLFPCFTEQLNLLHILMGKL